MAIAIIQMRNDEGFHCGFGNSKVEGDDRTLRR